MHQLSTYVLESHLQMKGNVSAGRYLRFAVRWLGCEQASSSGTEHSLVYVQASS